MYMFLLPAFFCRRTLFILSVQGTSVLLLAHVRKPRADHESHPPTLTPTSQPSTLPQAPTHPIGRKNAPRATAG